jgi:hypothetical protein
MSDPVYFVVLKGANGMLLFSFDHRLRYPRRYSSFLLQGPTEGRLLYRGPCQASTWLPMLSPFCTPAD